MIAAAAKTLSLEFLLESLGFRIVDGQWRQSDGLAVAGIEDGGMYVTFDRGVVGDPHTVHVVGYWEDPGKASAELPGRLKACYSGEAFRSQSVMVG